jgi:hypothetical protein
LPSSIAYRIAFAAATASCETRAISPSENKMATGDKSRIPVCRTTAPNPRHAEKRCTSETHLISKTKHQRTSTTNAVSKKNPKPHLLHGAEEPGRNATIPNMEARTMGICPHAIAARTSSEVAVPPKRRPVHFRIEPAIYSQTIPNIPPSAVRMVTLIGHDAGMPAGLYRATNHCTNKPVRKYSEGRGIRGAKDSTPCWTFSVPSADWIAASTNTWMVASESTILRIVARGRVQIVRNGVIESSDELATNSPTFVAEQPDART